MHEFVIFMPRYVNGVDVGVVDAGAHAVVGAVVPPSMSASISVQALAMAPVRSLAI